VPGRIARSYPTGGSCLADPDLADLDLADADLARAGGSLSKHWYPGPREIPISLVQISPAQTCH
jgi:hypothetical protein